MTIEKFGRHIPLPLKRMIKPLYRLVRGPTKSDRYDSLTARIIAKTLQKDSIAVDVGCHRGEILDIMLAHAPDGKHYCFEPLPDYAAFLRRRYSAQRNVTVRNCALSDTIGRTTFQHNVTSPDYSGIKRRTYDRGDTNIEQIEVELQTLDSVVPAGERVSLIKIDVEGAEYQVLNGARRVITEGKPVVVFEHGIGGADHYGTTPAMIFDLFSSLDYQLFALDESIEKAFTRDEMIAQFDLLVNHYFCAVPNGSARPF
jgi:FkbM family methyltransferase